MEPWSSEGRACAWVRSWKCELIDCFQNDPSYILQKSHSRDLLTTQQYRCIKSLPSPGHRVTELLDAVLSRGEPSCREFCNALWEVRDTYPWLSGLLLQLPGTGAPKAEFTSTLQSALPIGTARPPEEQKPEAPHRQPTSGRPIVCCLAQCFFRGNA